MGRSREQNASSDRLAWEKRSADRVGEHALERSREILCAARELVSEGGLEALMLRPLLDRSGLSRRAFYTRFESMDDVLLALFEDTMARGARGLEARIETVDGALEKIERVVRLMASTAPGAPGNPVYMLAMSSEHARLAEHRPEDLEQAIRPMNALLARILREGMAEGSVRKADPDSMARMLHGLVSSQVHRNLHLGHRGKRWVDDLCAFCLGAIRAS